MGWTLYLDAGNKNNTECLFSHFSMKGYESISIRREGLIE
jgi:hypothetical protein